MPTISTDIQRIGRQHPQPQKGKDCICHLKPTSGWLQRLVRHHVERNQTSRLSCRVRPAALFLKGTFGTPANTRAGDRATIPDALHRCGSISEAMSPIQATMPYQEFLLSVDTKRSPTT